MRVADEGGLDLIICSSNVRVAEWLMKEAVEGLRGKFCLRDHDDRDD